MEQVNLGYSTKNIPLPTKKEYFKRLIGSTEKFIRSGKALFYLNPEIKPDQKKSFGFKSSKFPPPIPELKIFDDEMLKPLQSVEFRNNTNKLQQQLSKDAKDIKSSDKLLIGADKTTNFNRLQQDDYKRLLQENITKDYKKATDTVEKDINNRDKIIAEDLELDDRISTSAKSEAFITLKDHKANFRNKPACRLFNPNKSEVGKISKQVLERINSRIRNSTEIN